MNTGSKVCLTISKLLRGSLMLAFAGVSLTAVSACELVGSIDVDDVVTPGKERPKSDAGRPPSDPGRPKPDAGPPPSEPQRTPECDLAVQYYTQVLTRQLTFPDAESYAAALDRGYAQAVAACGEGVVPPPPPVAPGEPRDERTPACEKALDYYIEALTGRATFPDRESLASALARRYNQAVAECGAGVVPPPPAL